METAQSRALTDETQRITYRASGLSFRQYNELYEKWLENRYSDKITPHTRHPSFAYDPYLTSYAHETRDKMDNSICAMVRKLDDLRKSPGLVAALAYRWRDMGQKKREEIVLGIWEAACRRSEEGNYTWIREDCPELTLAYATELDKDGVGTWLRLWETQGQTKEEEEKSIEDFDSLPYFNIRSEKWDRVNGVFEIEASALPVKKSIRAFVHDGIGGRNHQLRQFIKAVLGEVSGVEVTEPVLAKRATKKLITNPEEREMLLRLNAQGIGIMASERIIDYEPRCTYCDGSPEVCPPKMVCTICKAQANRIVRYCSTECFRNDSPRHRKVCGAPLTISGSVPSFASSSLPALLRDTSSLESPAAPSTSESSFPALSLRTLSKYPAADRSAWHNLLLNNPGAYWVICQGEAENYDPRRPLAATPMGLPYYTKNRYKIYTAMRKIAFDFITLEEDSAADLVMAFVWLENSDEESRPELLRQARWIAKLLGKEGEGVHEFMRTEFPRRLNKGLKEIGTNEKYHWIKVFFDSRFEPAEDREETFHIPSLIRNDLNEDPDAIWFTSPPAEPDKNLTQAAVRITGPELAFDGETTTSKFSKYQDPNILTTTLRQHIFRVLDNPGEDLDALGVLVLSIADPRTMDERAYKWFLWKTSKDLDLPEDLLVTEMERMRIEVVKRGGEEWDKIREGLAIIASQRLQIPIEQFPPLSSYSSTPPSSLEAVTSTLDTTSIDTTSPSDTVTTKKKKKKNKNKKKKKKAKKSKGDQLENALCESAGDDEGLLEEST